MPDTSKGRPGHKFHELAQGNLWPGYINEANIFCSLKNIGLWGYLMFEEGMETVKILLDNGSEVECGVVSIFPVPELNKQFIALNPLFDTELGSEDEIQLFSLVPAGGFNRYELAEIDESIFSLVSAEFFRIIES